MIQSIAQIGRMAEDYRSGPAVVPTIESQGDRFEPSQHTPDLALTWRGRLPGSQARPPAQFLCPAPVRPALAWVNVLS